MGDEQSRGGYRDRNSTADRALTVLDMFTERRLTVSAVEVAEELGVARSTGYRYLESLVSRGFLEESPSGGFRLGIRVLELARIARHGFGLSAVALPRMRRLSERFGQTVLLTRRAGSTVVCLEREVPAGQLVRISYERGAQLPLTAGASALVLLAWLPEDEARALLESTDRPRFTRQTLTEVDELLARLRRIRADGVAVTRAEVDPDAMGIAAPVFDGDGQVIAGLSIVALGSRVDDRDVDAMAAAVRDTAQEIGRVVSLADG